MTTFSLLLLGQTYLLLKKNVFAIFKIFVYKTNEFIRFFKVNLMGILLTI